MKTISRSDYNFKTYSKGKAGLPQLPQERNLQKSGNTPSRIRTEQLLAVNRPGSAKNFETEQAIGTDGAHRKDPPRQ